MLHRLFLEEQRALSDQFTRPFAEKISGYLRCLFGPGTQAKVLLENNAFKRLEVARATHEFGSCDFAGLSGGAKEQVAAAARLAMAEVLAQEHDQCLPLVFDDAFAYSDPQRVKNLQDMLGLAAERGLQVIVLTCNPSDYTSLGARQITITERSRPIPATSGECDQDHGMNLEPAV
jgi:ABC-type thiamine transport system ATPase subunit